jgi:hypothetical protein
LGEAYGSHEYKQREQGDFLLHGFSFDEAEAGFKNTWTDDPAFCQPPIMLLPIARLQSTHARIR